MALLEGGHQRSPSHRLCEAATANEKLIPINPLLQSSTISGNLPKMPEA